MELDDCLWSWFSSHFFGRNDFLDNFFADDFGHYFHGWDGFFDHWSGFCFWSDYLGFLGSDQFFVHTVQIF